MRISNKNFIKNENETNKKRLLKLPAEEAVNEFIKSKLFDGKNFLKTFASVNTQRKMWCPFRNSDIYVKDWN